MKEFPSKKKKCWYDLTLCHDCNRMHNPNNPDFQEKTKQQKIQQEQWAEVAKTHARVEPLRWKIAATPVDRSVKKWMHWDDAEFKAHALKFLEHCRFDRHEIIKGMSIWNTDGDCIKRLLLVFGVQPLADLDKPGIFLVLNQH
jgi:hypothetical protein